MNVSELIDRSDLDGLVRLVDALCDRHDWAALDDCRERCLAAHERGHQLWPVASLCEYRLALHAPGEWAAAVVREDTGRFAPGPLPEVAASTHTWAELEPWLAPGPMRALVAHERVVRGESLTGAVDLAEDVLDLPLTLEPWEPAYAVAEYRDDGVSAPAPPLPPLVGCTCPPLARTVDDATVTETLRELVRPWLAHSNGRSRAVAVEGPAEAAMAAILLDSSPGTDRLGAAEMRPERALAYLAWTAASGGAHGRRRGAAAGRFNAWWAAAALTGLDHAWPPDPHELGEAIGELRWIRWDPAASEPGWRFGLAVEDPADGLAWAIIASDRRDPDRAGW